MDPVVLLATLCVGFVGSHFALSHPPARDALIRRLGTLAFRGLYSVVSLLVWVPLAFTWWTHRHAGTALWVVRTPLVQHACEALAALGIAMVVAGFAQPAPSSSVRRTGGEHLEVEGLAHVTRHPVMWGIALLCLAHLPGNGWTSDLWFWGSHLALAILGAAHQDRRLATRRAGYPSYLARTTFLPNPPGVPRIGRRGLVAGAIGVAAAVGVRFAHG